MSSNLSDVKILPALTSLRPLSRASVNKHQQKHCRMPDSNVTLVTSSLWHILL